MIKSTRTTIKDIAQALQVSISTVSRALSDHRDISENTKKLVRETAELLNYTPNLQAKNLRSNKTKTIALILPEFNMFFTPSLLNGVNKIVENHGYSLIILQSDNSLQKEKDLIVYCQKIRVDGILLSLTNQTTELSHLDLLYKSDTPVVLLDKLVNDQRFSMISIDGVKAGCIAVEHLLSQGHKNILGVFGNTQLQMTKLREKGFIQAFESQGLTPANHAIVEVSNILQFDQIIQDKLEQYPETTAIFTMSDELLVRLHFLLTKNKIRIPEDISIVSISDGHAPYYLYPQISHVLHSGYDVGIKASSCLFDIINTDDPDILSEKIAIRLVLLNS